MKKLLLTLAALAMTSPVFANVICAECEYVVGAEGTYLGAFDARTRDSATFQHLTFEEGRFRDFWVFDVGPASGAASFLIAALGSLTVFAGQLFEDAGSECDALTCSSVVTGSLLEQSASIDGNIGLFEILTPGRYVLHITGVVSPPRENIYRAFFDMGPLSAREAGTLGLFGLGLGALGLAVRRHQR
jgi:hypothetical protein